MSTSAVISTRAAAAAQSSPPASAAPGVTALQVLAMRTALVCGCAVSMAAAAWYGDPTAYLQADPSLARLLRGMALIKALLVVLAAAAVLWRLGKPASYRVVAAYLAGCWAIAGAATLIWQLTLIPLAAIGFHVAEISMLVVAWREHRS
jgi:hypothetical protein